MPTNQSSPWGGTKLQASSKVESSTNRSSVSAHAKTVVATKVPFGRTSLELSRRKEQAKLLPCNVVSSSSHLKPITVTPSVVPVWENGDENKTSAQSQFTAVPDGFPTLPQQCTGGQVPSSVHPTGLKQASSCLTETCGHSSTPVTECQVKFQLPKCTSPQTSQSLNSSAMSRHHSAVGDAPLAVQPLVPNCNRDLFNKGQPTLQQTNNVMVEAADCSSLQSVPPQCLTLCELQGATVGNDSSTSLDGTKVEIRSTREMTSRGKCHSANPAAKFSQGQNSCPSKAALRNHLIVSGGPPPVLAADANSKSQPTSSLNGNKQTQGSQRALRSAPSTCRRVSPPAASPFPNGPMPSVTSASQEPQLKPPNVIPGSLVGCVTTQISAIHLTKQGQPPGFPPSSSLPLTEGCRVGETQLSGPELVLQVDGVKQEVPDELENSCSEDDSDSSSMSGAFSTASIALNSCIEEPMSLETRDDREERPALVPSLFSFIPPTLYFSAANEKVELLPAEQRRLLKWKMSTVTPNVVKHTIARSHFKVTKKSHDWLGCWGHHMKSPAFKAIGEHQKLNHFPGTFQIGRKDRLWRNLSKMQVRFGKREFNFFPRTFVLPQDIKLLRKAWEDSGPRQKWIIKPPASARGIGIQVIHKWSQMPRKRPLLVQKYLHKPYLISGNKFDLRIYVYVTSYDPLRIYIFSDGLVRFASCKYSSSMKTLSNKFMHLTNYSVNKKNSEYQTNSDDKACQGHKWALKALWQYLGSQGINTTQIWEKIKDIVIKTIIASEPYVTSLLKMHVRTPYSCHELFGFDIMLDANLKPWILEVNISPSLHSNTALDVSIKGQMIRDLLNLAGFHIPQKDDLAAPCSSTCSSPTKWGSRVKSKLDLSADEKVKRAFYLTQCYADQDFLATVLDVLTSEDVRMLAESEDEMNRRGEFERVFPSPTSSRYLRFFECPKYLNILLDQWEQKYWSNRTKGISLLRSHCQEGIHLGTTDPAHIWSKGSCMSTIEAHRQDLVSPSKSRVVVSQQHQAYEDESSDREVASVSSLPASSSLGSSVTSSACASPQPSFP
ncbi:hypothetical protein Q5P01_013968 [Channa striata]|uniref:Tubulin polyglutamylase TTLL4 n=1 Tax=Channa striata TaxID=64152 RepID=A0AA88ML23_CHASR|nr:hypothetical protein Q5P01_013968 [Channa striata]